MSLLWVTASRLASVDPLDIQRALDQVRDEEADKHQDDAKYAVNWEPLHNSDLHPSEHNGWMFMENRTDPNAGNLTTYKHGITRNYLHLDEHGNAWRSQHLPGKRIGFEGPIPASKQLSMRVPCSHYDSATGKSTTHMHSHYDQLRELGAAPDTAYNEDYIRDRNKRLSDAGYTVIS